MTEQNTDQRRRYSDLILSATGDGVYGLDCQGHTTFANPAAARMTGYDLEEMIGLGQHDLIHHTRPDGSPYPRAECPIYAAFTDGKVHQVSDEVFWRKDGSSFPVEYVSTPVWDNGALVGAVVSFRDITERKHAEDALRESEERYRKIFDSSYDAIVLLDADSGAILDVNQQACKMLDIERHKLMSMTGFDIHANDAKDVEDFWTKVRDRGRWETESLTCLAAGGLRIPARLSASVAVFKGRNCILMIAHDLRRRIEAEQRVRKLQSDLSHVSRLSTMGELASEMAHELNQPLTAMMNYAQASKRILETGDSGAQEKVIEFLDKATAQASRASDIIRGLRTFIKKDEADRSFEDINSLVAEASKLALVGDAAQDIKFEMTLAPDLPTIPVTKIRIQQVVFNLVRNAVEALAGAAESHIVLATRRSEENSIEITVWDNGPGLDEEISERLFQAFVTTKPEGMGVGLSICRSIAEDHGGRLWAEANSGRGMTFHFALPVSPKSTEIND